MHISIYKISHCFPSFNLHKECLPSKDGWGVWGVSGLDINVERVFADFTWIGCPQFIQKLPVPCFTGIITVIPVGPTHWPGKK